jgi:hypothetical protein
MSEDVTTYTAEVLKSLLTSPPSPPGSLADGSVTTVKIADKAVTTAKIADAAVTSLQIGAGAVGNANVADNTVTTTKIADGSVSTAKLADISVSTVKLADGAVTSVKIGTNAVGNTNIVDSAVATSKIADLNVTTGKLADGAVSTPKLADGAVGTLKIADGSITPAKLAVSAVDAGKIAPGIVGTTELAPLGVTTAKVADAAVTGAKIANATITMANLASDVTSAMGSGAPAGGGNTWEINVKSYGAKGDGTTDDSLAFQNAINYIWTHYSNEMAINGAVYRRANYKLIIPPGTYRIVSPKALMSDTTTIPFHGLTLQGAGKFSTSIFFDPPGTGGYLMYNNNCFLNLNIRDITFIANTNTSNFMYSYSTGIAQKYRFDNCSWGGKWGKVFYLDGTNRNSENAWYHCSISGEVDQFLYVPQSVGTAGDNFKNYNFYGTNFEVVMGSFVDMAYGSAVNIWGGTFAYDPTTTVGGTMFMLRNQIHNGIPRFTCQGARFDLPTALCKMILCEWGSGTVNFVGCDNASQQSLGIGVTGGINATFDCGDESGASVSFIGCSLQGKHEYKYGTNAYQRGGRATYQNCEVWHYKNAHEFIVLTTAGSFQGSMPQIKFSNCRGTPGTDQGSYVFDSDIGWMKRQSGQTQKKILKIANPFNGGLPGTSTSSVDAWLPMNAIITNVRLYMPAGSTASTGTWVFTVKTSDPSTATIFATASPTTPADGFAISQETFFPCSTDTNRHLVLSQTGVTDVNVQGFCLVEYMG